MFSLHSVLDLLVAKPHLPQRVSSVAGNIITRRGCWAQCGVLSEFSVELQQAAGLPLCFLEKTADVRQGESPAVHVEEPVSSTCCSLWNSSRAGMSDGGSGLGPFSFFNTQQCHLGFSDMGHFFCWCGVPSCCIFYAIPFLEKPWRRRRAPGHRPPRQRWGPAPGASALSLAASPHVPAVPWVCNLPAFILSAYMYKM